MKLTSDIANFFGNLPRDMRKLRADAGDFFNRYGWTILGAAALTGLLVVGTIATAGIMGLFAPAVLAGVVGAVSAFGVGGLTVGGMVSTISLGATAAIATAATFAASLGIGLGVKKAGEKISDFLFGKKIELTEEEVQVGWEAMKQKEDLTSDKSASSYATIGSSIGNNVSNAVTAEPEISNNKSEPVNNPQNSMTETVNDEEEKQEETTLSFSSSR